MRLQVEMLQLKSMEESIADAELALRAYLESLGTDPGQVPSGFGGCVPTPANMLDTHKSVLLMAQRSLCLGPRELKS